MTEDRSNACLEKNNAGTGPLLSVGDVCRLAKVTRKTLFYYDRIGILTPTRREGAQNSKQYDQSKIERLKRITSYREAGLHILEIRELLDNQNADRLKVLQGALARVLAEQTDAGAKVKLLCEMIRSEQTAAS